MKGESRRTLLRSYFAVLVALTGLSVLVHVFEAAPTGLVRTLYPRIDFSGEPLLRGRADEVNLDFMATDATLPNRFFSIEWRGFWYLPTDQTIDLQAFADDRVEVLVDDQLVLRRDQQVGMGRASAAVELDAGAHELVVRYVQLAGTKSVGLQVAGSGEIPAPLSSTYMFPERPVLGDFWLAVARFWMPRVVLSLWLVPVAVFVLGALAGPMSRIGKWAVPRAKRSWKPVSNGFTRVTGMPVSRALHVYAVSALAIAQPLFATLSREPAFFIARNTTVSDLLLMGALLCLGIPTVLVGIEAVATRLGPTAGTITHDLVLGVLTTLLLLPLGKRLEIADGIALIGLAGLAAGLGVLAYERSDGVRSFVTALSLAIVVVPALFLMSSGVKEAVVHPTDTARPATPKTTPPIVFVVFDEFALTSLMNDDHEIDRERYPGFARLASQSTWYRNASSVSHQTLRSVPGIVSGRYPDSRDAVPTRRYYPNNLFTMLQDTYRMVVFGRFLQLCPAEGCVYDLDVQDSLGALVADLSVIYAHIIAPPSWAASLPPVLGDWKDFAVWRMFREQGEERVRNDRLSEFNRFLETITPEKEGRLYFLHSLTPHMPYGYVPSGHSYTAPDYQGYEENGEGLFLAGDSWLARVLQQRYLLQVGFADRLVTRLIRRLKSLGVFDEALIIVTADHGVSFRYGTPRRRPVEGNHADVLLIPLFIKYPGQSVGRIRDRNVHTIDIVPTIASVLSTEMPYEADGHSVIDPSPSSSLKRFVNPQSREPAVVEYRIRPEGRYRSLEQRLRVFGEGLYALGPAAPLVGQSLSDVEIRKGESAAVDFEASGAFGDVGLKSTSLPLYVRGSMSHDIEERVSLAIGVNGEIVATTQSYREHGQWVFASMIPERSLRSGANRVEIFVVDDAGSEPTLTLVATSSSGD